MRSAWLWRHPLQGVQVLVNSPQSCYNHTARARVPCAAQYTTRKDTLQPALCAREGIHGAGKSSSGRMTLLAFARARVFKIRDSRAQ